MIDIHVYVKSSWLDSERGVFDDIIGRNSLAALSKNSTQVLAVKFDLFKNWQLLAKSQISHSVGPECHIEILSFVEKVHLEPRVTWIHTKVLSVVGLRQDEVDAVVSVMKVEKPPSVLYVDFGGSDAQNQEIKEVVEGPLPHRKLSEDIGIQPLTWIVLYREPEVGKIIFAKTVAQPYKLVQLHATKAAKNANVVLSVVANLKLLASGARKPILSICENTDIIKISEEENYFLAQGEDSHYNVVVPKLCRPNLRLLLVIKGREVCFHYTKELCGRVKVLKLDSVDTFSVGDAFVARRLLQLAYDISLHQDDNKLREALKFNFSFDVLKKFHHVLCLFKCRFLTKFPSDVPVKILEDFSSVEEANQLIIGTFDVTHKSSEKRVHNANVALDSLLNVIIVMRIFLYFLRWIDQEDNDDISLVATTLDKCLSLDKFSCTVLQLNTTEILTLIHSNLEDNVLFEGGGIVMNQNDQKIKAEGTFGNLANYIWDPG